MPTVAELPISSQNKPSPRFQLSDSLKKDAKGAVKTAVELLGIAASLTQNVPYLGIISSVLTEFLKIQDEVSGLKSEWKGVIEYARQIQDLIDNVRSGYEGRGDDTLPPLLTKPIGLLETCIVKSLETLNACKIESKRYRDRVRVFLSRGDIKGDIKQCDKDMERALNLFNARVNVINMHAAVRTECRENATVVPDIQIRAISSIKLPPPPQIFHGRMQEVEHAVNQIVNNAPARVAILGSGGIGKTSIAQAAMHHPAIVARYGDRRFFISCEAAFSAESVVSKMLTDLGVIHEPQRVLPQQDVLLTYLRGLSDELLLCLDNFETPWDADRRAVEDLLGLLTSLPNVAVLITSRGSTRPKGVRWTQPFLEPISPLTRDASLQTWDAICGPNKRGEYTTKLIQAVDDVPLAVTLLANLVQSESLEALWDRWELEHASLLQDCDSDDRLSNVHVSISLSLNGPRLRGKDNAIQFLSILCQLPQGIIESRVPAFVDAFADTIPDIRASITLLKQCSLIYLSEDGFLRTLSPIMHYMQSQHRVTDSLYARLAAIYFDLVESGMTDLDVAASFAHDQIQKEVGNVTAVFRHCLELKAEILQRGLRAVLSFSQLCHHFNFREINLLDSAIQSANDGQDAGVTLQLLLTKGDALYHSANFEECILVYTQAREFCIIHGEPLYEGLALSKLGDALYWHGGYDEAKVALELALALYQGHGLTEYEAHCQLYLGLVSISLGHLHEADSTLHAIKRLFESPQSKMGSEAILWALGNLYIATYQFSLAETELSSARKLSESSGAILNQANCLQSLGLAYIQQPAKFDHAKRSLRSAVELYSQIGNRRGVADCLGRLGQLSTQLGDFTVAEDFLLTSVTLHVEAGHRLGRVTSLNSLGALYHTLRRYDDAHEALQSALGISSGMPYPIGRGDALLYLGKVAKDCGRHQEAAAHFRDALGLFEQAQDPKRASSAQVELDGMGGRL
ncbi:TPR-like protein [Peniophora sp. CONT]|nr:TPR-like protein [Peniophora sp. CONT]